jgi:RHS repeat-associated protein
MNRFRIAAFFLGVLLALSAAQAHAQDTVIYYHTDAIGSVRAITDANGQVVARYDYLPFGEPLPGSPPPDTRQFAGKERDTDTGFDYFGARFYESVSGRFTTIDPVLDVDHALVNPQLWSRYSHGLNNPLKFADPDGRNPVLVTGGIGAAVYAAWNAYLNVQQGRAWYQNIGLEASKGFLVGATLGLAAPALAPIDAGFGTMAASAAGNVLARASQSGLQFADRGKLDSHVADHLREFSEFGFKSAQDYVAGANKLIDAAIRGAKGVESFVRSNGDVLAYKISTNEFAVATKQGVLRTYFRPKEQYEYWLEQIAK